MLPPELPEPELDESEPQPQSGQSHGIEKLITATAGILLTKYAVDK